MLNAINHAVEILVETLLVPFRGMHPLVGLAVISLLVGIGMLQVFKVTSDQEKLSRVKSRIHASLFEIRLFNDDLRAILRSQSEILRHNGSYLRLSLVPMFWMIVPLVLIIAQLQAHYGYRGLSPGDDVVVQVELQKTWSGERPPIELEAPEGLRVETPGVWIPSLRQIAWRLGVEREGEYELAVVMDGARFSKRVLASDAVGRRSPVRERPGLLSQILYPAEKPLLKSAPIQSIEVAYPGRQIPVLRWHLHWLVVFFVLSMAFAFALKGRMKVTI